MYALADALAPLYGGVSLTRGYSRVCQLGLSRKHRSIPHAGIGAALLSALSPVLSAADRLDGITITAPSSEGVPRTGDVVTEESAVAREHIPAQRFTESGTSLARVIGRSAGAQTRGAGGFGSVETLSIRAGTTAQTGVYLDGIRLNRAGNPSFDFATLDILGLDSVDVYRGGTPLALGGGDIGGAVNLRSPDLGEQGTSFTLGGDIGSFGARGLRLGVTTGYRAWRALGAIGIREADNDFEVLDDNGTSFNPFDDEIERRTNADASRESVLTRLQYTFNDTRQASVLLQASSRDTGVPTPRNNPDNDARFDDDTVSLQLAHTADGLGFWNTRQTLFANVLNSTFDDQDSDVGLGAQLTDSDGTTFGARFYAERIGDAGTLAVVLELSEETLEQVDRIRDGQDLDAQRLEASLLTNYALWLRDESIVLTPGIEWRRTLDEVSVDEAAVALRGTPESTNETAFNPRLGVRASLGSGYSLRANVARNERSPSFTELFGDSGLLISSSDLVSESGVNADIALHWQDNPDAPRHHASIGVFGSDRDDLIATVFDARGVGRAENIGGATVVGLELELSSAFAQHWSLDANLTWQDTRQVSDFGAFDGQNLPGQAELAASARIEFRHGRWRAWYGADYERNRFFDTANLLAAPDSTVQHAGIEWKRSAFALSLSLDNLGDVAVEDFRGFPRPGRSAFFSVQYKH